MASLKLSKSRVREKKRAQPRMGILIGCRPLPICAGLGLAASCDSSRAQSGPSASRRAAVTAGTSAPTEVVLVLSSTGAAAMCCINPLLQCHSLPLFALVNLPRPFFATVQRHHLAWPLFQQVGSHTGFYCVSFVDEVLPPATTPLRFSCDRSLAITYQATFLPYRTSFSYISPFRHGQVNQEPLGPPRHPHSSYLYVSFLPQLPSPIHRTTQANMFLSFVQTK